MAIGSGPEYAIARALLAGAQVRTDLDTVGVLYVNAVRVALSAPGSGRVYRRRGPNGGVIVHQASAPGESPAVDTGVYRASWMWRVVTADTVQMYPNLPAGDHPAKLGEWLEFGTRHMAARPHARPAASAVSPLIGPLVARGIEVRERGAG